jgi:sec-independent protein translocase protein TatB
VIPNIGSGEMIVLLVAALVILGPERLPGAIKWAFEALRKVREYATGATQHLREELGPEFDELRQPLAQLQQLRGMTPRSVITRHLLDGDDSLLRSLEESFPGEIRSLGTSGTAYDLLSDDASSRTGHRAIQQPLRAGERPPIDTDAT